MCIGALTNAALLLMLYPEVTAMIEITIMGGCLGIGAHWSLYVALVAHPLHNANQYSLVFPITVCHENCGEPSHDRKKWKVTNIEYEKHSHSRIVMHEWNFAQAACFSKNKNKCTDVYHSCSSLGPDEIDYPLTKEAR